MKIYLKNTVVALTTLALSTTTQAAVVFTDDFSYTDGQSLGSSADWNVKWQSNSDQQNLVNATSSGTVVLDTSIAQNNYHAVNQTGFSLSNDETATLSIDFRFTHNATGTQLDPFVGNAGFFGLGIAGNNQWYQNPHANLRIGNRGKGNALGFMTTGSPQGWLSWNTTAGFNPKAADFAGATSNWLTQELTIAVNGGNYTIQARLLDASGTQLFETTAMNTALTAGSTVYSEFTTGYTGSTGVPAGETVESMSGISSVEVDNFSLDLSAAVVPEPSTYAMLIGLCSFGFVLIRRKK
ncbi:MAG: PEP-CTERM sorting domain-containing protein [Coraliomargaritaceae bacterium]